MGKPMKLIASVDNKWGIGKNGKLLVNIPEDMQLFRQETYGNVVVMGRKTYESLPYSVSLDGRVNIVLSENKAFTLRDAIVCHSVDEVLAKVEDYTEKDVYVIGGESIYTQFLPYCNEAHLTRVDYEYDADVHFPDLDKDNNWEITAESDEKTYFDIIYKFVKYERK